MNEMSEQTNERKDGITATLDFEFRNMTENLHRAAGTRALKWALATLDSLSVDTLYIALKVYDRSLTPDDNCGHSVSADIQDLLNLFPENARQRYDYDPCTMLDEGVHDAVITSIHDGASYFIVVIHVKGSGDDPETTMSKKELDAMFLKVGIPEGTAPDAVKDFSCRVLVEH